ncbi:MAG: prohibitin family protein [Lentisphaerae bacterium]|nr:prohibitin family protein [Lentisphaerota bacterium]
MAKNRKFLKKFKAGYIKFLYTTLILVLVILFFWPLITVNVHAGEAAVLWRRFGGGIRLNHVYGEGVHFIFPWDRMTVYNTRLQTYTYTLHALSLHGLPVELEVAIRYRPERNVLPYLHKEIGPDYLHTVIIPEVSSALRAQMGVLNEEEIYANRLISSNTVSDQVGWDAQKKFLHLDAIRLTRLQLPEEISQAIREKMIEKEKLESYLYLIEQAQREAERLAIQSSAISNYNFTVNASLSPGILQWKGIEATRELATSQNAKMVIMGNGNQGLPVILNAGDMPVSDDSVNRLSQPATDEN